MSKPKCGFAACERESEHVGLCHAHYEQRRRGKSLTPLVAHALTFEERFWAKVRKTDNCWIWIGSSSGGGYGSIWRDGKCQKAHRVSLDLAGRPAAADLEVDHMCHVRLCVNPAHLQAVPKSLNQENRSGLTAHNTSGHRGVKWNKARRKWEVAVKKNGRNHYGGLFLSLDEAAKVATRMRNELFTNNLLDRKSA